MANILRMIGVQNGNEHIITPYSPATHIGPSNTYRVNAWGGGTVGNNTEIISIGNNIHSLLPEGDVRKNYALIGAIWTDKGTIPPIGTNEGSTKLANSTMETYEQELNCFSCHQTSGKDLWGDLRISHIFNHIKSFTPKKK